MLQIMAVIKEQAGIILEWLDDVDFLAGHHQHGIFPTAINESAPDRGITLGITVSHGAGNHPELLTMQVNRMRHGHHPAHATHASSTHPHSSSHIHRPFVGYADFLNSI